MTASTARAVFGNKFAAGVLDRVLAAQGTSSQQTSEPRDPDSPDNLWLPLDDEHDHGAHGRFDARSAASSRYKRARHRLRPVQPACRMLTRGVEAGLAAVIARLT